MSKTSAQVTHLIQSSSDDDETEVLVILGDVHEYMKVDEYGNCFVGDDGDRLNCRIIISGNYAEWKSLVAAVEPFLKEHENA